MLFKKRETKELIFAYKEIFESDKGQMVLRDLMQTFHVFNSTMSDTPEETAYKEGERSVVLRIFKTINIDPSQLDKIVKEGQSERY
jgi:hypothetical protein